MSSYQWHPITDLPGELYEYTTDVVHLAELWQEQSQELKQSDNLKLFHERLKREWAIETGIIENLYSIDRGTTQLLIEKGFDEIFIEHGAADKPSEYIFPLLDAQKEALEGLFDFVSSKRPLTTSYIKELHALLTRHQEAIEAMDQFGNIQKGPVLSGDWKKLPNNPKRSNGTMHEYCPPEQVASEMDRLLEWHNKHLEKNVSPDVEAAWLHHRFTQIHPFQDGNGRVARCLATLIFLRANFFPLVINRDRRSDYINALERVDQNDLYSLIDLFVTVQKNALKKALSISHDVLQRDEQPTSVIKSAAQKVGQRKRDEYENKRIVFQYADHVKTVISNRLQEIEQILCDEFGPVSQDYQFSVDCSDESSPFWFKSQIIQIAKQMEYFANTKTYTEWVRLKLIDQSEQRQCNMVFSLHSLGYHFSGMMAASAFMEYKELSNAEAGKSLIKPPEPLTDEIAQFSYREAQSSIEQKINQWLNQALVVGLDIWRQQL